MMRSVRSRAVLALILGMSVASGGCGRFSISALSAKKAYKEANEAYKGQDWKKAAEKYEYALANDSSIVAAYFFLGNSYDNLYKPARAGEAENDANMKKAIDNYKKAAELDTNPQMKTLALQYLVAAYGPEKLNDPAQAEPIVQQMIKMEPNETNNYFQLMKIYEDAGRYDEAEAALLKARDAKPTDPQVYTAMSGFYNRQGDFTKTMESLQKAAEVDPKNPQNFQLIAVFYWEKASKDHRLSNAQKKDFIMKGIDATDKALALNPDYSDALTYKNILLRMEGNEETDMTKRKQLYDEADRLRNRAIELNKKKASGVS
jgi:tetratricopeptide (TPR) repeat protein